MTILMLETIDDAAMPELENAGTVVLSPTPDALAHDLPFDDVSAIITRGMGQLNKDLLDRCQGLKVIARCGAGLNNVDLKAAAEKNIPVVFAPGLNAVAVAEHTLMLMLMCVRKGFSSAAEVKNNNWAYRSNFNGDDLCAKKVCIVGGGSIGKKVADLCRSFSMDVEICGRNSGGIDGLKSSLAACLPSAHIVSIHIPLNSETENLFDEQMLSLIKSGAVLINTARGELVKTSALINALNSGNLAGYGADVVEGEIPKSGNQLVDHENTVITPHVASLGGRTYREMSMFTAKNVASVLMGKTPNPVSIYNGAP